MELLTLVNEDKSIKLVLSPFGASIYAIYFNDELMTLTPENKADFELPNSYYGKTIGPFPNRVSKAQIKSFRFTPNEGVNLLHSGSFGYSHKTFNYVELEDSIVFSLETNDKQLGKQSIKVEYKVLADSFEIYFFAESSIDLPFGLTNHAYFNLGEEDLTNISLQLPANYYIKPDEKDLLPIAEVPIIFCLDFNNPKSITKNIENPAIFKGKTHGYDHCFKLSKNEVVLRGTKYEMLIKTDFEYCQIYSDNYADGIKMIGTSKDLRRGLAIEPQDSILDRPILKKSAPYRRTISYTFKKL